MKLCKEICQKCIINWSREEDQASSFSITDGKFTFIMGWTELDESNWQQGEVACPYSFGIEKNTIDIFNANPAKCIYSLEQLLATQKYKKNQKGNKNGNKITRI